uniref:G-protein coupled receptors family 1 profile domain-containing protein n=1 Tax=Trichobilharzia regenti TaxID=157069 RepID=A0AA85KH24_TRIRE|nr:unnamed protein product [Trichobilharzia regenti]
MLDGTLWIEYNSTCSGNKSSTGVTKLEYSLPILVLSIIALILNTLCISVFTRQHRKSVMRTSLLVLSATEVLFHSFVCIEYTTHLISSSPGPRMITVTEFIFFALINWGSDCSLCTRNWCNVLITSARTEVVVYPMRKRRLLSHSSIKIIYGFLWILSGFLGIVRAFYDYAIICAPTNDYMDSVNTHLTDLMTSSQLSTIKSDLSNINDKKTITITHIDALLDQNVISNYEAYCFFVFQVIAPTLIVLIMSFIISFYVSPWRDSKIIEVTNVRRRNQMKATRTILFLAISFLCFQTPSFILVIIQHYTTVMIDFHLAKLVADLLLTFDSVINIMIYAIGLPGFRIYLNRMFTCLCPFNNINHSTCNNNDNNNNNRARGSSVTVIRTEFHPVAYNITKNNRLKPAGTLNNWRNSLHINHCAYPHNRNIHHGSSHHRHRPHHSHGCNHSQLENYNINCKQDESVYVNEELSSIKVKEICDEI